MTDTLPADYERLAPWLNILRQMNSIVVFGSAQIISITVLIDEKGIPYLWSEPERRRLYPRAKELTGFNSGK